MPDKYTMEQLLEALQSAQPETRTEAWLRAGEVGPQALEALAKMTGDSAAKVDSLKGKAAQKEEMAQALETGRAAKRAMWKIVRSVGAPGGDPAVRQAAAQKLAALLGADQPLAVRREAAWMISEIGGDDCVDAVAGLLADRELREDARMVLERIPGEKSLAALNRALNGTPPEFRNHVAHSLRVRGVEVSLEKYPLQKMVPTKQTQVRASAP